ncbi:MAG: hypothetical protein WCL32_00135 [Planctomycetota bacterium]
MEKFRARVSGIVTYEGKPLETGAITFFPVDGKSPTAGAMIAQGEYSAVVALGEMKVVISAPKIVGRRMLYANNPQSPEMDLTVDVLPERYNERSTLKVVFASAVEKRDFDLKKDAGPSGSPPPKTGR